MNPRDIERMAAAFEHSEVGMALQAPDGRWLEVNPAFCALVGYDRVELLSKSCIEITHPEDVDYSLKQLRRMNDGELRSFRFDKRFLHGQGREVCVRLDVSVLTDDCNRPELIITQAHDITTGRMIRQQLADSEAQLRSVVTAMAEGMLVHGIDGRVVMGNRRASEILGLEIAELTEVGWKGSEFFCIGTDAGPLPAGEHPARKTLQSGQAQRELVLGVERRDGKRVWIEMSTEPVRSRAGGDIEAVVATFSDITARVETERALKESEQRLSLALEGANMGMWDWIIDSQEFIFSQIAARILGYRQGELSRNLTAVLELAHPADESRIGDAMTNHLDGSAAFIEVDSRFRRKSGGYMWTNIRGRVTERHDDGRPVRVTGILTDISERKKLEARLQELATTDELTGLANRRHGNESIRREIDRAARDRLPLSLVLLDIDHFKSANDRFGHDVGDRLLKQVADLLLERIRKTDIASRWGGEEFAIVLPNTSVADACRLSTVLLESMTEIVTPDGQGLSASFGVAGYCSGESPSELVKRADRLMYAAKASGRARVESSAVLDDTG